MVLFVSMLLHALFIFHFPLLMIDVFFILQIASFNNMLCICPNWWTSCTRPTDSSPFSPLVGGSVLDPEPAMKSMYMH